MNDLIDHLPARRGHFVLESGHHGDLWLDLELLCLRPRRLRALAVRLAPRLARHDVEIVCGPLVEGAMLGLLVAEALGLPFTYAEPGPPSADGGLFPVSYQVPQVLRVELAGRRVAVVNDVINAGSAVRGTLAALKACDARPVTVGCLAILGTAALDLAARHEVQLEMLDARPNALWTPSDCPQCADGVPLSPSPFARPDDEQGPSL